MRRNAQYNSMATNLNIVIGKGNVGAVGIRLRGAQGSGIEDVTVHASVLTSLKDILLWDHQQAVLTTLRIWLHASGVMGWPE